MEQPELLVEDYQKTQQWFESHLKYFQQLSYGNAAQKKNDEVCWQYYNNKTDVAKFEYLTQMGNFHLPSQIRHVPLQRNNCDLLISAKARRPFVYDMIVADRASMEEKFGIKIEGITNILMSGLMRKYHDDASKITQIDSSLARLQQVLQQQPQNEEQQQQQTLLQQNLPLIQNQFSYLKDILKYDISLTDNELDEIKVFAGYKKKDWKEEIAIMVGKKLRRVLNIDRESTKNFISDIVIGRGAFYVDLEEGKKYPTFRALNMVKVYYPKIDGIDWIQDCPWVKIEEAKSFQQIALEYGDEIRSRYGEGKLKELQDYSNIETGTFASTPGYGAVLVDQLYSGSNYGTTNIVEEKIFFKVPRKIKVKYSPNPYVQGEYYRKFLDGEKVVIDKDKYRYEKNKESGNYYVNKADEKDVYREEQVEPYSEQKGQKVQIYYINDIYQGVIINRELFVRVKRKAYALRNPDRFADVKVPVYGRTHASINDQPYSIVKDTINLQDMYDLIGYYRDLMFALSGPKTILYDRSFKPTTMTDDEWEYQKKLGMLYVQTYDKTTGQRNPSTFNTFTMYDMTLPQSVQYFDYILESIKETMGEIVGVPRQRKGQVVNTDQVGTYEMSLKQAALITEIRYDKHDEVEAKAFEAAVNLYLRYCLKENDFVDVINKDFSMDIRKITKNVFSDVKIEVVIANNSEQERLMSEMKDIALVGLKSGTMQYEGIVRTFLESSNLIEFKEKVEYFTDKAQELMQQNAMAAEEKKAELLMQNEKLRQEYEGFWKQKQIEAQMLGDKIVAENNRVLAQLQAERNQIERDRLEKDSALKLMELVNEDKSESNLLAENKEARINQQKLDAMKVQLETLINTMGLRNQEEDDKRRNDKDIRKINADIHKTRKLNKEHISDR